MQWGAAEAAGAAAGELVREVLAHRRMTASEEEVVEEKGAA